MYAKDTNDIIDLNKIPKQEVIFEKRDLMTSTSAINNKLSSPNPSVIDLNSMKIVSKKPRRSTYTNISKALPSKESPSPITHGKVSVADNFNRIRLNSDSTPIDLKNNEPFADYSANGKATSQHLQYALHNQNLSKNQAVFDSNSLKYRMSFKQEIIFWVSVAFALILVICTALMHVFESKIAGMLALVVLLCLFVGIVCFVIFFRVGDEKEQNEKEKKGAKFVLLNPPLRYLIDPGTLKDWKKCGASCWTLDIKPALSNCCEVTTDSSVNNSSVSILRVIDPPGDICVISNFPLPAPQAERYFEITILELDQHKATSVAIGLSCSPYPYWRFPGYHATSIALFNSGYIRINGDKKDKQYSAAFSVGDTIGVRHSRDTGAISFSLNGTFLGIAGNLDTLIDLYPCFGADAGCVVSINFGSRPFVSNIHSQNEYGLGCNIALKVADAVIDIDKNHAIFLSSVEHSNEDSMIIPVPRKDIRASPLSTNYPYSPSLAFQSSEIVMNEAIDQSAATFLKDYSNSTPNTKKSDNATLRAMTNGLRNAKPSTFNSSPMIHLLDMSNSTQLPEKITTLGTLGRSLSYKNLIGNKLDPIYEKPFDPLLVQESLNTEDGKTSDNND